MRMRKRNELFATYDRRYGAFDGYWFIHDFSTYSPYLHKVKSNGEEHASSELYRSSDSEDDRSTTGARS